MRLNFIQKKNGYFQKWQKSQKKVGVAEEIGCQNEIGLSKIGRGNEFGQF